MTKGNYLIIKPIKLFASRTLKIASYFYWNCLKVFIKKAQFLNILRNL